MNTSTWISIFAMLPSLGYALPECSSGYHDAKAMFATPPLRTDITTMKIGGRPDDEHEASIRLVYKPSDPNIYAEVHFSNRHIYHVPIEVCLRGEKVEVTLFSSKMKPKNQGGPEVPADKKLPERVLLTVVPTSPRSIEYHKNGKVFLTSNRPIATASQ